MPIDPNQLLEREWTPYSGHWNRKLTIMTVRMYSAKKPNNLDLALWWYAITVKDTLLARNVSCWNWTWPSCEAYATKLNPSSEIHDLSEAAVYLHCLRRISPEHFVNDWFVTHAPFLFSFFAPISEELFDGRLHFLHVKGSGRSDRHTGVLCTWSEILVLMMEANRHLLNSLGKHCCGEIK